MLITAIIFFCPDISVKFESQKSREVWIEEMTEFHISHKILN